MDTAGIVGRDVDTAVSGKRCGSLQVVGRGVDTAGSEQRCGYCRYWEVVWVLQVVGKGLDAAGNERSVDAVLVQKGVIAVYISGGDEVDKNRQSHGRKSIYKSKT